MAGHSTSLIDAANPVAFFANGIGDAILSLPALRALTEIFPGRLTLVNHGGARYLSLFKPLTTKRQLSIKSGTKCDWDPEEIEELAATIGECDLFISLVPWVSPSLKRLIQCLRPAKTIGYFAEYDISLPRDYTKHTAELTFDAVRAILSDCKIENYLDPPSYLPSSIQMAQAIKATLEPGVRILAIHMETQPEKMWDSAKVAAVVNHFLSAHPEYLAVSVSYKDYPLALAEEANQKRLITQRRLLVEDAFCLVHYADCFLGIDSCMLHAADFGRVPAVGLFGSTSAKEFGFLVGPHIAIQAPSDVNQIEVEHVIAAMESLLKDPSQRVVWHI